MSDDAPMVTIGRGEPSPWEDLDLTCPTCGEGPLPLRTSESGVVRFIRHCGRAWVRGPIDMTGESDDPR